ncbi:MAG: AMP-binding protein [bacterium]|nr:AMP-binding protein [bacterium]
MAALLSQPANAMLDKPARILRGSEITFHELRRLVFQFANALDAFGVRKGERVGTQLPTCPQYATSPLRRHRYCPKR